MISISAPNYLHARITIDAVEAGKHAVFAGPFTLDAAEARRLAEEERREAEAQAEQIAARVRADVEQTGKHLVETLRGVGAPPPPVASSKPPEKRTESGALRLELAKERREDRRYWARYWPTVIVGIIMSVLSIIGTLLARR